MNDCVISSSKSSRIINLNVAYNTGAGTIFFDRRSEVQEQFKGALMSSAANLLFDDWVTIGQA